MTRTISQFTRWFFFALVFLLIINIGIIFLLEDSDFRLILSDIFFPLTNLMSAFLLLFAALNSKKASPKSAWGWGLLCLAQFLFTLGDIFWSYYEIILQIEPFPSPADFFYIAYYPFALIGISLLINFDESRTRRINRWLDIVIILIAINIFFGATLLSPLSESMVQEAFIFKALILAYPIGDIFLLAALLLLIYQNRSSQLHLPIILIGLNLTSQIATDVIFSYQSLFGTYISGGWLDSGWLIGFFLIGLAGYIQSTTPNPDTARKQMREIVYTKKFTSLVSIRDFLPYILVIAAYVFLYIKHVESAISNINSFFFSVGLLLILVFIRQFLTLRDNIQLNFQLHSALQKTTKQAEDLTNVNKKITQEIDRRKKLEKELVYSALHDPLTNIPNRRLFFDRLDHAIKYSKRYPSHQIATIYMDIDDLKKINDKYGHEAGDQVLIHFCKTVSEQLRKSDTFARLGGDEFAIILENNDTKNDGILFAQRLQEQLDIPFKIAGVNIQVRVSIGIVGNAVQYDDPELILRNADHAMYQAKDTNKGGVVVYSPDLQS
jgi:diguanylate cyclase (GGDEF)-like protein